MPMTVLIEAQSNQKPLIDSLLQVYLGELSRYTDDIQLQEGRYVYPYLSHYWHDPARHAFLIQSQQEIGGFLLFAYAIMQVLFAPIIGGLSDRFGRRPVLLVTLALLGVDYAIMAWAPTLAWLFVGRIISGIMGASWAAANSGEDTEA